MIKTAISREVNMKTSDQFHRTTCTSLQLFFLFNLPHMLKVISDKYMKMIHEQICLFIDFECF